MGWKSIGIWLKELKDVGFKVKNVIVWDKVIHGLNYMNYAYTHEFIIFAVKGNKLPNNKPGEFWKDIWHIPRNQDGNQDNEHHETVKNIQVVELPIIHSSEQSDIILDPFIGVGTTAVACKNLNRNYIGIEISEKYCEIARQRLRQNTLI